MGQWWTNFVQHGYRLLDLGARACALLWISIAIFTFGGQGTWFSSAPALAMAVAFLVPVTTYLRHRQIAGLVSTGFIAYALALVMTNTPSQIPWVWVSVTMLKPLTIGWGFAARLLSPDESCGKR